MNSGKLWLYDINALFGPQLLPNVDMSLEIQINTITRLVILVTVIILLLDFKSGIYFFLLCMAVILGVYFVHKNKDKIKMLEKENYTREIIENYTQPLVKSVNYTTGKMEQFPVYNTSNLASEIVVQKDGNSYAQTQIRYPQSSPFYNDAISIDPPSYLATTLNQNLANPQRKDGIPQGNPVTRIPPVVVPKSHDLSYWRDSELITHSAINKSEIQQDMYLSGYAESTCCGYLPSKTQLVPHNSWDIKEWEQAQQRGSQEGYVRSSPERVGLGSSKISHGQIISPIPIQDVPMIPSIPVREGYSSANRNQIISPVPIQDVPTIPSIPIKENYTPTNIGVRETYGDGGMSDGINEYEGVYFTQNGPGEVNTSCGYNPSQVYNSGLPSNFSAGNCQQDPKLKCYNQNLFTQTITPDVYMNTQIVEPINSNIGISFQQQFEPLSCYRNEKGLHYVQRDPRILVPETPEPEHFEHPNYDNVYDPRFYGYGTSYRSYIDNVTGQPRFMYDDINAVKMPNYVVRSKIDFLPYADTYGPVPAGNESGNVESSNMRALAQDSWLRNSIQFRDEMTEMLMRKPNAVNWQRRMYPLGPRQV